MKISEIKETFSIRKVNEDYVNLLASEFERIGYQNAYPVSITRDGVLWDGNNRLAAAKKLGWSDIPHIEETPGNLRLAAHQRNQAAENNLPMTFVDHAEEIWSMRQQGKTQQQVADEKGWSRTAIANYDSLKSICNDAWKVVVTVVTKCVTRQSDSDNGNSEKAVTFTEGLLRSILSLTPEQQTACVKKFANGNMSKASFAKMAQDYKDTNELINFIKTGLSNLPKDYQQKAIEQSNQTHYLREWQDKGKESPKLQKLIKAIKDEFEKKHSYQIIIGKAEEELAKIESNSIDCIITDPPYLREYLPLYGMLAKEAARVLKSGGNLVVMTGQSYLPEILALMTPHIPYHWTISYLTPGGQAVQLWNRNVNTFWKPVLWFVKGKYDGQWIGDVCKSDVNDNDKNHHKWGQSESGMADLVSRVSMQGDTIIDPFCGAGTTGVVAVKLNRKFIGIESDKSFSEKAISRIEEVLKK